MPPFLSEILTIFCAILVKDIHIRPVCWQIFWFTCLWFIQRRYQWLWASHFQCSTCCVN